MSTTTVEGSSKPPAIEDRLKPVQSLLGVVQSALSVALGLVSLTLLTGFVIVNSYLARVTDIHGFSISNAHYIAAGFLYLMIWVVLSILISRWSFLKTFLLDPIQEVENIKLAAKSYGQLESEDNKLQDELKQYRVSLAKKLGLREEDLPPEWENTAEVLSITRKIAKNTRKMFEVSLGLAVSEIVLQRTIRMRQFVVYGSGLLLLLGVSAAYAVIFYPVIPRTIGGGKPSTIVLSLKSEYPLSTLLLSNDTTNQNNTATVWLLAELNDGLLVADQTTGRVVAVKNDLIAAVIDDTIAESLIITTTTPVPTETPMPATPTP